VSEIADDIKIVDNVFVKMFMFTRAGDSNQGHAHAFDHITLLASGSVRMEHDNGVNEYKAPFLIVTPKNISHKFTALEAGTLLACIHAVRDGDGIDDKYDLEENTKVDCPVDAKGRLLDSDGDGCPDCEDPEPFSTPLLPIVDCKNVYAGFASKECCDEKALLVPAKDKCADVVLPSVSFDYDRFGMGTGSYASLEQIAKTMQDCPDLKVVVNGVTNTTKNVKYNEQLSWLRTNEAVEHLVEKYGISRDRFIVTYQ
jgi:outer membrane protein OmpA-like peptidoglycan-associated protein